MLDVASYIKERKGIIKRHVAFMVDRGDRAPRLAIITDNKNFGSNQSYIKSKTQFAMDVGIDCDVIVLNDDQEFIPNPEHYDGIIVQYPFRDLSFREFRAYVTDHVSPTQDVDGLGLRSLFSACTPLGIVHYLDHLRKKGVIPERITVNVIGAGGLVGKPLVEMLMQDPYVSVCVTRSGTDEWVADNFKASADVVVCATPTHNLIKHPDLAKVWIDCGCNLVDGKLLGNVSREAYTEEALITPVPGGVGRMTVLSLFDNVIGAYLLRGK